MIVEFFGSGGGGGGGTDTNLGTDNLVQADATRSFKVASGGVLKFLDNGGNGICAMDNNTNVLSIGDSTPYNMPVSRGTINELLHATDGSGNTNWATLTTPSSSTEANTCEPFNIQGIGQFAGTPRIQDMYVPNRNGIPTASLSSIGNALSITLRFSDLAILQNGALYETGSTTDASAGQPLYFWFKHWNTSTLAAFGRFVLIEVDMASASTISSLSFTKTTLIDLEGMGIDNTELVCAEILNPSEFSGCKQYFLALEVYEESETSFGFSCGGGGTNTVITTTTTPTYS